MMRIAIAGQSLTEKLQFPSHWRVVGCSYDAAADRIVLVVDGAPEVATGSQILVHHCAGALVYTACGKFLGAREASRHDLSEGKGI